MEFDEIITSEEQFRDIMGEPGHRAVRKAITTLDDLCRAYIASCPFLVLATSDGAGHIDVSPKGDAPGFVQVLDEQTLAIPDRPGNRRADSFRNLLRSSYAGVLFLIPGKVETLRVSGEAMIVRDLWLRERMAAAGKVPDFAIVVQVKEVFFHCGKCMLRSKLWDTSQWLDISGLPSLAQAIVTHGKLEDSLEQMQAIIDKNEKERLY